MELIDFIFDKIKIEKIKTLPIYVFFYMISQTSNSREAIFIVNKLEYLGVTLTNNMKYYYLLFVEDFNESIRILKTIKNSGLNSTVYQSVIETTDTLEQAMLIYDEMIYRDIKPTVGTYITLMERQISYKDARKILNDYILSDELYRQLIYSKKTNSNDIFCDIFPILYLKAKQDDEVQQIKDDLVSVGMSTDMNDYEYYSFNCGRWLCYH